MRGTRFSATPAQIPLIEAVTRGILGHQRGTADAVARLLLADPGSVLGLCARGFALALLCRRGLARDVRALVADIETSIASRGATPIELAVARSLARLAEGDLGGARGLLDAHAKRWPHDLLALKLAHALHFLSGDTPALVRGISAARARWSAALPGYGFVLGCDAFAQVEAGVAQVAEATGRAAVELEPEDAWGRHAIAHALVAQGRLEHAIEVLREARSLLPALGNFGGHLAWHEAFLHTTLGRPEPALALYDEHVCPWLERTADYRDVANASTLLPRLKARLVDRAHQIHARQERIAAIAKSRLGDHGSPFGDIHYVMCLSAVDLEAARAFLDSMRHARGDGWATEVNREVGAKVAEAIVLLASGSPAAAAHLLRVTRPEWPRLGGSQIQRSVLEDLLTQAGGEVAPGRASLAEHEVTA